MIRKHLGLLFLLLALGIAQPARSADVVTASRSIGTISIDAQYIYIGSSTGNWGVCSPLTITHLIVARSEVNARDLLALALSAKTNSRTIFAVAPACPSSGGFFSTNLLVIE